MKSANSFLFASVVAVLVMVGFVLYSQGYKAGSTEAVDYCRSAMRKMVTP